MFEKLFRRKLNIDIDQLIFDIAEQHRKKDYNLFVTLVKEGVFFCKVDPASVRDLPEGQYTVQAGDDMKLTGLASIQGMRLLPLYTSRSDTRLGNSYVGLTGKEALRMVLKTKDIDGLLFQNASVSWVVLQRQQVQDVLAKDA